MQTVLSLCDYSGNILKPWAEAGYRCIAVDIKHSGTHTENGIEYVQSDVLTHMPPIADYAMCFAFPPCTHLAVSGARWFHDKGLEALNEALELVIACKRICEWVGSPWMLENPVSTLATYWRKPDFTFNPYEYGGYLNPIGDAYTKRTCLWTGGGFVMPERKPVEPIEGSKMHRLGPGEKRAELRSVTPMGFAQAVFEANHNASDLRLVEATNE